LAPNIARAINVTIESFISDTKSQSSAVDFWRYYVKTGNQHYQVGNH